MSTFPLSQIASALGGQLFGSDVNINIDIDISQVVTDSRAVKKGDLFIALQGERFDGHDFISTALQKEAYCLVVEAAYQKKLQSHFPEITMIVVDDTLLALGQLALSYRLECDPLVIGVTGSVGKTTTRHMIHSVLSQQFQGMESPRNFNNEVGVPLSLLTLKNDDEYAVLELAAGQQGDIRYLSQIVQPEFGVITAIGDAHLETFGSQETIIQTKAELIEALPRSGVLILAGDDIKVAMQKEKANCKVILVGCKPHNDLQATDVVVSNHQLTFRIDSERISVPVSGRHYITAILAAIAIGREVGMDAASIQKGLQEYRSIPGRSHIEKIGSWTVINDCYNANPLSMQAACDLISNWDTNQQKIFVAGDMLSLGIESRRLHFEFGQAAAHAEIDFLLAIGSHCSEVARGAIAAGMSASQIAIFEEWDTLFSILSLWIQKEDVVLIKGSRGMHMERTIDWLRQSAEQERDTQIEYRLPKVA